MSIQTPPPPTDEAPVAGWGAEDEVPEDGRSIAHPFRLAIFLGVIAALAFLGGWAVLAMVLALVVMIFMHELGHYLTAKWSGMKVTEFFLGFGPRIWSFRRGETEYGIKAIWAGAYVKIIGMNNLDEVDPADEDKTYRAKSYPRRMSVAVAGSTMHFLMALVLAFVALAAIGVQAEADDPDWTGELSEPATVVDSYADFTDAEFSPELQELLDAGETPASAAGLQAGDRLVAADGEQFDDFLDLRDFVRDHPEDTVTFTVERGDETFDQDVTIGAVRQGEDAIGVLGFAREDAREPLGVVDAAQESVTYVGTLMSESVQAIGRFFTPSGLSGFADAVFAPDDSPSSSSIDDDAPATTDSSDEDRIISIVGATRLGAQATDAEGIVALLNIMVILNVFIGLFNLIPLLPFDGGHVAVGTYERIREIGRGGERYHADLTKMLPVAYAVVLFMVAIGAMALYADIADPINFTG